MLSGLHPTTLDSGAPGSSSQLSRKGLSSLRFLRARSIELVLLVHGWNLQEGFGGMKTNNHTVFLCYPSEAIYGLWRETRKKSVNGSGTVKVDKKHTVQHYCVILCAMLVWCYWSVGRALNLEWAASASGALPPLNWLSLSMTSLCKRAFAESCSKCAHVPCYCNLPRVD